MKPWHQDDSFWKVWRPILFTADRVAQAPAEIAAVLKLAGVKAKGGAVLDLCCGIGRHSLELARRGFRVTGVDRTRSYLAEAKAAAKQEKLAVEFVLSDARTFVRPGAFDLAINLYTSFGYFRNPADDRRVARNLCRSLRPGGALVMDLMGKERLARIFMPHDWHREPDGTVVLEERFIEDDWTWVENVWTVIRRDRTTTHRISHRLYSAFELATLLKECGFRRVKAYGSLGGAKYDQNATRMILVARK